MRLVVILGPTASGKSSLAIQAARALDGEIVNCDSMQLHRGLSIGTDKPNEGQRSTLPHHLYDRLEPDQSFSAGRYMTEARHCCSEISGRGKTPFVVGGTGLYLKALLEGVFEGPGASEPLRKRLKAAESSRGPGYLHRLLKRVDPRSADRIQAADQVRIVRAIEVFFLTSRPISDLRESRKPLLGYSVLKVGIDPDRLLLYGKIDRRVGKMFEGGFVDEVKNLLAAGFSRHDKGFEALGYRHVADHLEGSLSREAAIEATRRDSRRYAKRQLTWFRREEGVHWLSMPGEDPAALERFLRIYQNQEAWLPPPVPASPDAV